MNQGQFADIEKLLADWLITELALGIPIRADYNHDLPLPYIIVTRDQPGQLDRQEEIHGREPGIKVEIFQAHKRPINELSASTAVATVLWRSFQSSGAL